MKGKHTNLTTVILYFFLSLIPSVTHIKGHFPAYLPFHSLVPQFLNYVRPACSILLNGCDLIFGIYFFKEEGRGLQPYNIKNQMVAY
jgi:hypothetical protein